MPPHSIRPEDRQRSRGEAVEWADTVPLCFRSEAFAEDLLAGDDTPSRPQAAGHGFWPAAGSAPLLGLALSSVMGLLQR